VGGRGARRGEERHREGRGRRRHGCVAGAPVLRARLGLGRPQEGLQVEVAHVRLAAAGLGRWPPGDRRRVRLDQEQGRGGQQWARGSPNTPRGLTDRGCNACVRVPHVRAAARPSLCPPPKAPTFYHAFNYARHPARAARTHGSRNPRTCSRRARLDCSALQPTWWPPGLSSSRHFGHRSSSMPCPRSFPHLGGSGSEGRVWWVGHSDKPKPPSAT
jgi:hypothetical protein